MFQRTIIFTAFLFALKAVSCQPVLASERYTEADLMVDNSLTTLKQFLHEPNMQAFRDLVRRSRGIIIVPQMLRGGLVLGGTGGSGVLMAREGTSNNWLGPAFYSINSITFGIQVGAEASKMIMLVMTEKGLHSMLSSSFKLGADVTMAAGPVGGGTKATTADIISYAISRGAFGGFTVEGAVMKTRNSWNTSYYGVPVLPVEILVNGAVTNSRADELKKLLSDIAAPTSQLLPY